jgi:hypothetical protein
MKLLFRASLFVAVAAVLSLGARAASAQGCCKAGLCKIPQLPASGGSSQISSMLDQFDNGRTQARPASAASVQPQAAAVTEMTLSNPLGSNQKIEYILDGKTYALEPGMSLSMRGTQARRIEFSRDGNGTKAAYRVSRGAYEFAQTDRGWELYRGSR